MASRAGHRSPAGFTLLELLLAVGIGTVVVGVIFIASSAAYRLLIMVSTGFELMDETRRAADTIRQATLEASRVAASHTVGVTTYTTDADTLVLELPAWDPNGNRLAGVFDWLIIERTGSALTILTDPAPGSRRRAQTQQPTSRTDNFMVNYFAPDGPDSDLADERIIDPALFPSASRVEAAVTTQASAAGQTINLTRLSNATLRGQ